MAKPTSRDDLLEASFDARAAAWSRWGTLESDVLSHAVNPSFMGGPRWPGMRQAYRVAHKGHAVLIASDGLSDPYDEDEGPADCNGIGLECFAVTDDPIARPEIHEPVMRYGATWLHDLVFQTSQTAARHGDKIATMLDELEVISLELWDVKIPATHSARFFHEGRVGVLLSRGAHPIPTQIAGALSTIRLMHIQLLTVEELGLILEDGLKGRLEVVERLRAQKVAPLSRLDRPSVV